MRTKFHILVFFGLIAHVAGLATGFSSVDKSVDEPSGPVLKVSYASGLNVAPEWPVKLPDSLFHTLPSNSINLGFSRGWHWFRVSVRGLRAGDYGSRLEIRTPIIDEVVAYLHQNGNWHRKLKAGDAYSFNSRLTPHRFYQVPLETTRADEHRFLVALKGGGEQLQVDFGVMNPEAIAVRDRNDLLLHGLYFGILLFVVLFNLFLFLVIRERSSLHYVGYITTLLFLQLALRGYAFQYIWPNWPYMAQAADPFFASLSIFFLLQFSRSFLRLYETYPAWNKVFRVAALLVGVNAVASLIPVPDVFYLSVLFINGLALVLNLTIIPLGWGVWRKGFGPARFFIAAFFVLVLSVFGFILSNFGVIQTEFFSDKGLLLGSACEVILLSFAIVDRFRKFKEESVQRLEQMNLMKEKANLELEDRVKKRTDKIVRQKDEIESQKEEIVSSIRYAQRIQSAILPGEEYSKKLFPGHFVYFKPCDIVSGDFYWMGEAHTRINGHPTASWRIFAVVDCTGHGVPGALMSMMGFNYISDIVSSENWSTPAEILDALNHQVVQALSGHDPQNTLRDGMDLSLCAVNPQTLELFFAGANQSVYIVRDGEVITLRGDRRAIGAGTGKETPRFTSHHFQLNPHDMVYTFTDGIVDQFGGEKGKKLKINRFREFLCKTAHLPATEQMNCLKQFFEDWKTGRVQIDDVCVIGLRPVFKTNAARTSKVIRNRAL